MLLGTTTLEDRLNELALLHIHRKVSIDLEFAVDEFALPWWKRPLLCWASGNQTVIGRAAIPSVFLTLVLIFIGCFLQNSFVLIFALCFCFCLVYRPEVPKWGIAMP